MEDIINQIDGKVQVIFEKNDSGRTFRDALWMTQEEYDITSSDIIESIKQERFDNWLTIVNAVPTEEPEITASTE
jgi:hypothetical protein